MYPRRGQTAGFIKGAIFQYTHPIRVGVDIAGGAGTQNDNQANRNDDPYGCDHAGYRLFLLTKQRKLFHGS
jgi:hypothetical protein